MWLVVVFVVLVVVLIVLSLLCWEQIKTAEWSAVDGMEYFLKISLTPLFLYLQIWFLSITCKVSLLPSSPNVFVSPLIPSKVCVCSVGSPVSVHYPTSLHNDPRILPEPVASLRASHCSPVFYLLDNGKMEGRLMDLGLFTDTCLWFLFCGKHVIHEEDRIISFRMVVVSVFTLHACYASTLWAALLTG